MKAEEASRRIIDYADRTEPDSDYWNSGQFEADSVAVAQALRSEREIAERLEAEVERLKGESELPWQCPQCRKTPRWFKPNGWQAQCGCGFSISAPQLKRPLPSPPTPDKEAK